MERELWDRTPGKIDFKNWGPDARSGWPVPYQRLFQDSVADYGRFLELWTETARYIPPNSRYPLYTHLCILNCHRGFGRALEHDDPAWIKRTFVTIRTM